jgi:hypothetical protein
VVSIASSNGQSLSLNASAGTIDVSNLSPGPSNIQVQSGGSVLIGSLNLHNSTLTLCRLAGRKRHGGRRDLLGGF